MFWLLLNESEINHESTYLDLYTKHNIYNIHIMLYIYYIKSIM